MSYRSLRIVVAVAATVAFAYVGRHWLSEIHLITVQARPTYVLAVAGLHLATLWLAGLTLRIGLNTFQPSISRREGFALSILGSYSNLLVPRAGMGVIGVYLKRFHRVTLTDFGCVLIFNTAVFICVCSLMGSPLAWTNADHIPYGGKILAICLVVLAGVCLLILMIPWKFDPKNHNWLFDRLKHLQIASSRLGKWRIVGPLFVIHAVMMLMRTCRLQIAFWSVGIHPSFEWVLIASLLSDLAFLISITPTALGFREAAIVSVATQMGISASTAISVAILDRIIFSLTSAVAAQIMFAVSFKRMRPNLTDVSRKDADEAPLRELTRST